MAEAVNHTARAHATYAPSSASKWMVCGRFVREAANHPGRGPTKFTQEGTAAHMVVERCLEEDLDAEFYAGWYIDLRQEGIDCFQIEGTPDEYNVWEVDGEMVEAVQLMLDTVRTILKRYPDAELYVETRIDLRYLGYDIWGTGDVMIYVPSKRRLYVIDYKHGKGYAVEANQNPQLMVYGTGGYRMFEHRGVDELTLVIVQPRIEHQDGLVRVYRTDWSEIGVFEARMVEAMDLVLAKAGDHCSFCPLMGDCKPYLEWLTSITGFGFTDVADEELELPPISSLSMEQLGRIRRAAKYLRAYVRAAEELAYLEAVRGRVPPGTKLVEGKSYRRFFDPKAVARRLRQNNYPRETYIKETVKGPAAIEKSLGKRLTRELVGDLIYKAQPKLTLVEVEDPRKSQNPAEGFTDVSEE